MASFLNEELMGTNLDIPNGEIKIDGKVNPVYADAINVHNKKKKEREKVLKDKKDELKKPFLGTKGNTTAMPKTKDMKKLKLSEDMFRAVREHMNDAPEAYDNIFRVIGNMEHILNYISELTEEELTYEDMQQSYNVLDDAMREFEDYLFEIKAGERKNGTLKESSAVMDRKSWELKDKRNNKDTWSDIYNELVGIKGIEAPHRRLKTNDRYKASWGDNPEESDAIRVGASRDGGIVVKAEEMSALDFAKEVAETYGVEWRVKEHTSRYADAKYELFIYPDRPVVDEGLTKAERHNRMLDRVFQNKRDIDARMSKFLKDNSDITDDELKKVQDDDNVGLELKNRGLHDRYWNEVEAKKESLKEDKNGKFVGQFSRIQTDDEMNGFVNLIKTVAQENGFDTSKMTVDNSTNVSNKTPYGVGTNIKVTIPIQGKDKPFRASNKDTISGLTNVVFTCTAEKGYSDYDNHIDQLKIDKGLDKDDFDAEQFTIRATTNGTVKPYRKRYTHRLEGRGHYMYNGIIEDFRQDLDTYFRELKTYLGI